MEKIENIVTASESGDALRRLDAILNSIEFRYLPFEVRKRIQGIRLYTDKIHTLLVELDNINSRRYRRFEK